MSSEWNKETLEVIMFRMIDFDKIDLLAPVPEGEPLRQYYFMKRVSKWVEEREKESQPKGVKLVSEI